MPIIKNMNFSLFSSLYLFLLSLLHKTIVAKEL
nr:MAG TPA: hypothetical protein [Caudoviricetes sp.]